MHFGQDLDDARGEHDGEPAVAEMAPLYVDDGKLGSAVHYEPVLVDARAELMGLEEIDDAIIESQELTVTAWVRSTPDVASPSHYRAVIGRGPEHWAMTIHDPVGSADFLPPAHGLFFSHCETAECLAFAEVNPFGNNLLEGTVPVIEDEVVPLWHHLAMTYEPSGGVDEYTKRIYTDGELDAEITGLLPLLWGSTMEQHIGALTIGAGPDSGDVYHGEIDELHLASQAWDAQRIRAEHAFADRAELVMVGPFECR